MTDLKRVIAYSTISQIGYMVMGVSVAAYGAGLFHLMTHAFFKALLFMCAGSVIGAMAGIQDMDRMGGFRRAMPFTFITFTIGALALAGFPLTLGLLLEGRDPRVHAQPRRRLRRARRPRLPRRAALTAFYAFRMVFRVFLGDPVPEARELEGGHIAHGDPVNPMTGEPEDTDVGFPGPEHHIAERAWPMKAAMGPLAVLAIVGGYLAVPGVTDVIDKFLEPTFADSRFHDTAPSEGAEWLGLVVGGRSPSPASGSPGGSTCAGPAPPRACVSASPGCTPSSSTSGTSTSSTTRSSYGPWRASARSGGA